MRKHGLNELSGIQSTADTQTKWLLDPMMAADLSKPGVDFDALRKRPTTIYVMIHPMELRKNKRWTRLITSAALCALMQPGAVRTLMVLDEFYASVGNLPILNDVWSLVRGYGIQIMPILQSILQLQALYQNEWENYAAQAGLVMSLGPAGDNPTAEWMSKQCGVTTILKASLSENDGFNIGDGTGSGTTNAGMSSNSNQNSGRNRGAGMNWQQSEAHVLKPQDIKNIRAGHGLAWVPGLGTKTIPYFAPNYFRRNAPWVREVRENPYRGG